jgi:cytidylate kinase
VSAIDTNCYTRRPGRNNLIGCNEHGIELRPSRLVLPAEIIGVIPIDGNPRSGKGTMADMLRAEGIAVLDTGQGYRSAAMHLLPYYRDHIGAEVYDDFLSTISDCEDTVRAQLVSEANIQLENWIRDGIKSSDFTAKVAAIMPDDLGKWAIQGEVIDNPDINLYVNDVTTFVSVFARQSEFREHFNGVSANFIRSQHAMGRKFVGTDGRSERQIVRDETSVGTLKNIARLATAFFFEVDYIEAARRDLLRRSTDQTVRNTLLDLKQNTLPEDLVIREEMLAMAEIFRQRDYSDRTRESNPMSPGAPEINLSDVFNNGGFDTKMIRRIEMGSSIYIDTTGVSYEDSLHSLRATLLALGIIAVEY